MGVHGVKLGVPPDRMRKRFWQTGGLLVGGPCVTALAQVNAQKDVIPQ